MFRMILNELLATTPGALAALFLDYEGETVDLVCDRDLSDHDLRIIGAYLHTAPAKDALGIIADVHRIIVEHRLLTPFCFRKPR